MEDIKETSGFTAENGQIQTKNCHICGKEFTIAEYLKRHIRVVHGPKHSHYCDICVTSFDRDDILKTHIKEVHENNTSWYCKMCNKFFNGRHCNKPCAV